uniref:DUF501 domain-containing protein n=1 Tax=Pinguiococcus pyrenoidosus TaxID=172671 RepID=A0A7R9YDZ3_9STRA|mmetsp:Transcript_3494/g.13823  ORF Transcript_3494/g.13823 Transcript_3494/m.13823 type:complete len:319 (+) Transcript_3494:220-1176(+)
MAKRQPPTSAFSDDAQEPSRRASRRVGARRKRHAKKRARDEAEASDLEDIEITPDDRARMPHLLPDVSDETLKLVREELGYLPTHLRGIAAWDERGRPAVLQLYPLGISQSYKRRKRQRHTGDSAEPFPTMLWLASKAIGVEVARLEYQGAVARLEKELQASEEQIKAEQRAAHQHYARVRWEMVSDKDRALCEARGWTERIRDTGVAGMKDFDNVKCLHAHYAHFLALEDGSLFSDAGEEVRVRNHVGAWVDLALKDQRRAHDEASRRARDEDPADPKSGNDGHEKAEQVPGAKGAKTIDAAGMPGRAPGDAPTGSS